MQRLVVNDLRAGRNGTDPPLSLKQPMPSYQGGAASGSGECVDALNVDWYNATLARKRGGADNVALAFSSGGPFTGVISFLGRHVPGIDETLAELWAVDDARIVGRLAGGTTFTAPSLQDVLTGNGWDVTGASIHGKYFLSFQSAQNRLHCWDPKTSTVRRTGITAAVAGPVTTDGGGGTYPPIVRYYRMRWIITDTGVIIRRSEPSPIVTFTPSGSAGAAHLVQPTPVGEGETDWEIEVSLDNASFFLLTTLPLATTTYDDSAAVATYSLGNVSALTGTYALQKSYRFLAVDQNRVLGFGSWTTTDPQNRIEFSAITGSTNISDEERVPLANFIDLDETDSGAATGLVGPVLGAFYAFKYRQIWKLVPTGVATSPYSVFPMSKVIGAVAHHAIRVAEDQAGNPAIYFESARGPYRLGTAGLEYLGKPNEDLWLGPTATVNLAATHVVAHAIYHTDKRQVWFWYASGISTDPDLKMVYDVLQGAWSRHTGPSAAARCSVMFSNTIGATMSRDLKPYIGNTVTNTVLKCDSATMNDNGTNFQAYVLTKPYSLGTVGQYFTVGQGTLIAKVAPGVTITQTLIRDLGLETRSATVNLSPNAVETRTQQLLDGGALAGAWAVQIQIGDDAPVSNAWSLDALTLQYIRDQALA